MAGQKVGTKRAKIGAVGLLVVAVAVGVGAVAWADSLPRITTFGRLGLFAHDNTHHALAMAYDAVDVLRPEGLRDDAAWRTARERFAAHVVED